jgi:hypothetical protein
MHIYYRISDKSYEKPKLIGATKEVCLMNFVRAFHEVIFGNGIPSEDHKPPMTIIADRCERKTIKMLMDTGIPVIFSDLGNAGSLRRALEMAVKEQPEDQLVYFVEDDYLHLGSAPKLLQEGIKRSDYVSLYDHPDKYTRFYNLGEYSKVIKTPSSHWRFTISTTMTFATTVKTLKEDFETWMKYTDGPHPHDHHLFTHLGKQGRKLAIPIPGVACHVDLFIPSKFGMETMEHWAIELMIKELEQKLQEHSIEACDMVYQIGKSKTGWEKLVALDALRVHLKKNEQ